MDVVENILGKKKFDKAGNIIVPYKTEEEWDVIERKRLHEFKLKNKR